MEKLFAKEKKWKQGSTQNWEQEDESRKVEKKVKMESQTKRPKTKNSIYKNGDQKPKRLKRMSRAQVANIWR